MIIKRVQIENYRQYRGPVEVQLGLQNSRNVNIIIGSTGSGKTNFSNALNWCFYGEELSLNKDVDFPIWNLAILNEISSGNFFSVSVKVLLEFSNGEEYLVTRRQTIIKNSENMGEIIPFQGNGNKDGTEFRIDPFGTKRKNGSYDENFPVTIINQVAPQRIREFFFFDGEKLGRYFNSNSSKEIKEAIFNVSQLDILQKIIGRFETIRSKYQNLARECSPKSDEIGGKISVLEEKIKNSSNSIESKKVQYVELTTNLEDLNEKYRDSGGDDARQAKKEYDTKTSELDKWEEHLQEKMMAKRLSLMKDSYLLVGMSALKKAHNVFKLAEENEEIPSPLPSDYIQSLISKGYCICNTKIGNEEKNILQSLITRANSNKQNKDLMHIGVDIDNLLSRKYYDINEKVLEINNEIEKETKIVEQLRTDLKNIEAKLSSIKDNNLDMLWGRIQTAIGMKEQTMGDVRIEELQLKGMIEERSQLDKDLEKENAKTQKGIFYNACTKASEEAMNLARSIQEKVMREMRIEIAKETEQHYIELHWKKGEKIEVLIDDAYNLQAIQAGKNKLGAFSAGEKALMAISFISALNRVSGFSTPIVMDTALGRIDVEASHKFATNIATYLEGTQIIFLFTSKEYSNDVKQSLKPYMFSDEHIISVGVPSTNGAQQSLIN